MDETSEKQFEPYIAPALTEVGDFNADTLGGLGSGVDTFLWYG